jgi:uncharacterized membrane protein
VGHQPVSRARSGFVWALRHWLSAFVLGAGLFIALPLAAPLLAEAGHHAPAATIYAAYRVTCHQMPQRSLFVGGAQSKYSWDEIRNALGAEAPARPFEMIHKPISDSRLGSQTAFCQRDTAIYASLFLSAVAYAGARRTGRVPRPLPFGVYAVALVPMALDGGTQLVGLRESTLALRLLTGGLFGAATAFFVLPRLDEAVIEIEAGLSRPAEVEAD